jgi:hypothetical protein
MAMLRADVPVRAISFVPFLGAGTFGGRNPDRRLQNAYIALSGPVWGALLAFVAAALAAMAGPPSPTLLFLAGFGALLNLLNLLPIFPVDGGRVVTDVAYSLGGRSGVIATAITLLACAIAAERAHYDMLALVVVLGLFELGPALAALPYGPALTLLRPGLPMGSLEHAHFQRMVSPVDSDARLVAARYEQFRNRVARSRMVPMRPREAAILLGCHLAVGLALVALIAALDGLPGSSSVLQFLR